MPKALLIYVKPDAGLFRKTRWKVLLDDQKIGDRDTHSEAVELALSEAERSAKLGRQIEVWANNGEGLVLVKSFQPVKKNKGDLDDDEAAEEYQEVDDNILKGDNAVI